MSNFDSGILYVHSELPISPASQKEREKEAEAY